MYGVRKGVCGWVQLCGGVRGCSLVCPGVSGCVLGPSMPGYALVSRCVFVSLGVCMLV